MLKKLLDIEILFGRIRKERNGPRTLDLDILLFKKLHVMKNDLVIPHPRMHERLFVLLPLFEVAPDIVIEPHGALTHIASIYNKPVIDLVPKDKINFLSKWKPKSKKMKQIVIDHKDEIIEIMKEFMS